MIHGTRRQEIYNLLSPKASKAPWSKVWVTNGVYNSGGAVTPGYSLSNRVVITENITVSSVNGPLVTTIVGQAGVGGGSGTNAIRGVFMSKGWLKGFTLDGGHTLDSGTWPYDTSGGGIHCLRDGSASVTNCIIINGSSSSSGGGTHRGEFFNCVISNNIAGHTGGGSYISDLQDCRVVENQSVSSGGGFYSGNITRCVIRGNFSGGYGGGASGGTIRNSSIFGNICKWDGGGTHNSSLYNCTVSCNKAGRDAGGTYRGWVRNCIIYYNHAEGTGDDRFSSSSEFSCASVGPLSNGSITNNPILVSSSRIHTNSPCNATGSSLLASGTDLDGDLWTVASMGCDNPSFTHTSSISIDLDVSHSSVGQSGAGIEWFAHAWVEGYVSSNRWTFGDGTVISNTLGVKHTWANTGVYPVVFTAFSEHEPVGVAVTNMIEVVAWESLYVDVGNTSPELPFRYLGLCGDKHTGGHRCGHYYWHVKYLGKQWGV